MEKQEFTIEKSTVECYKIRHESGRYWADITVDVTSNGSGIAEVVEFETQKLINR